MNYLVKNCYMVSCDSRERISFYNLNDQLYTNQNPSETIGLDLVKLFILCKSYYLFI